MRRELSVGAVDLRVVEVRPLNPGLQIIRVMWPALLCGRGVTVPFAVLVNGAAVSFSAT
jgi:hypothetical protein